jgi:hypothetical protein
MNTLESIVSEKQVVELFGQPLPEKIDLIGELPDGMIYSTKQEALGVWAEQIHAKALFLKPTRPAEIQKSDDVYAIVICIDANQHSLVAVVVKTNMYNIKRGNELLRTECDQIASCDHRDDFQTYPPFISKNDAFMLRTGKWFENVHDGLSNPIDAIPVA